MAAMNDGRSMTAARVDAVTHPDSLGTALPRATSRPHTTPAGIQATSTLFRRRLAFFSVNVVSWLALMAWATTILATGGWTLADLVLLASIAIALPWPIMGFWNALIGVTLLAQRNNLDHFAPYFAASTMDAPVTMRTAVIMTLRNEGAARAISRLATVKSSLDRTGYGDAFSYFVLSDTNDDVIAAAEQAAIQRWKQQSGSVSGQIIYRRRLKNTGFKAGNVRDFCQKYGDQFTFMLPLDADSVMSGNAIVKLVRIMQAHPRMGILQSLVVGAPSTSAFTRIFQFGMRHGMRSYTAGQAWWTGDCGPFWGHNAVIRIAPFFEHCGLPTLPGKAPLGGAILSHDHIESTLMRRAGYEVRVMPIEDGSYEDNPPDAVSFLRRELRWCQGNMQYTKLRELDGLKPVSRFQIVWAILMFVSVPAWTLGMIALPFVAADAQSHVAFPTTSAALLYLTYLLLTMSPKLMSVVATIVNREELKQFGGGLRYALGVALETVFSLLQGAGSAIRTSLFMIGLLFGQSISWNGQDRDGTGISWRTAFVTFWPALLFGIVFHVVMYSVAPDVLVWVLPMSAGYILTIPLAVVLASPRVGAAFVRHGIAGVPEDFDEPAELAMVRQQQAFR